MPTYRLWELPAREFAGQWDALVYDSGIKRRLLSYAHSALLFSRHGVDPQLVSCNRYAAARAVAWWSS